MCNWGLLAYFGIFLTIEHQEKSAIPAILYFLHWSSYSSDLTMGFAKQFELKMPSGVSADGGCRYQFSTGLVAQTGSPLRSNFCLPLTALVKFLDGDENPHMSAFFQINKSVESTFSTCLQQILTVLVVYLQISWLFLQRADPGKILP